jgi:starch synthase (maltosyl-transferring)
MRRVAIEGVTPEIDGGRFPVKRTVGERLVVEADAFADGHDLVSCELLFRREESRDWSERPMEPLGNDRFRGDFAADGLGRYRYTIRAWVDRFLSWSHDFSKRVEAGQQVSVGPEIGAKLVEAASRRASGADRKRLTEYAAAMRSGEAAASTAALSAELASLMARHPDRDGATLYGRELTVVVDRERARFSAWYEMFPRSCSPDPERPGTLADCEALLPYVEEMGFDVLYLAPIHPIGRTNRKGKNNRAAAQPSEPGSPWAIGGAEGGHKAIHPELGTLEDFHRLVARAREHGLEIALDIAFQGTPDHPYVREHPEWFRKRPDGTIQYAENPPKKYEDIYPFDFEAAAANALWEELKSVVLFWVEQGVRIFRVDNPHTKPFDFWEWLIGEVKREYPEVIFLSEAFTRPKVMYRLAKLGFTQSYTYFAWRNTAWELADYFRELTQTPVAEFFRPNLWPNTPDILTEYLQFGGRPAFVVRLVLAATLGASYGIYGPAFELAENRPREPGSEEYLDSEKYEIRHWDRERLKSLKDLIAAVNRIRRENPALHGDRSLRFHRTDNEQLFCYSKGVEEPRNVILVVVNLDPHHTQAGWVDLDLAALGLEQSETYQVHDLLTGARYVWHGARNYVELDSRVLPAHVLSVRAEGPDGARLPLIGVEIGGR